MPQTLLITGASTGIGKAAADLFFERGWNVVATMRTPKSERVDPRWHAARLDVTDPASIDAAIKDATQKFGRIDVIVNNAGYACRAPSSRWTRQRCASSSRPTCLASCAASRRSCRTSAPAAAAR